MNLMNWFKKRDSAISILSKKIFDCSILCAEPLKTELEQRYKINSEEYSSRYISTVVQFMCFFMHITNRFAFSHLGKEKMAKLQEKLHPILIDFAVEKIFKWNTKEQKNKFKNEIYKDYASAEAAYSNCKEMLLKPQDDVDPILKLVGDGKVKSKGIINQLIDRVAACVTGKTINTDVLFPLPIIDNVTDILNRNEINNLVLNASKEI